MKTPLAYATCKSTLNVFIWAFLTITGVWGKAHLFMYYRTRIYQTSIKSCLDDFVYDNIHLFNQNTRIPFDTIYNIAL